jgi:hypothetical protein
MQRIVIGTNIPNYSSKEFILLGLGLSVRDPSLIQDDNP